MSETKLLRLPLPKFFTRTAQLRSDQGYGVGRTGMIKRWTITTPNVTAIMEINGIPIILDGLDGINFDSNFIRNSLRDILPETSEQNMLCAAESTLFGTQLLGIEYYRYFPSELLFNYIFTGELCVTFFPACTSGDVPDKIDIEEEYVISEAQLLQRLRAGETLDDIDTNCQEDVQTVSFNAE